MALAYRPRLNAAPGYSADVRVETMAPTRIPEFCLELFGAPLHWADRTRCVHAIKPLLSLGANDNLRYDSVSPLDLATAFHLLEIVLLLFDNGAEFVDERTRQSALH